MIFNIVLALTLVSYKWTGVELLIIRLFQTLNQPLNQNLNLPLFPFISQLTFAQIQEDGSVYSQASRGQSG